MPAIRFLPIDPTLAAAFRDGAPDSNGQRPERSVSDGSAPCRLSLRLIPEGAPMLILGFRPFATMQPYAECGPIFLSADPVEPWTGDGVPPILASSPRYMIRGYSAAERIVYGSGAIVDAEALEQAVAERLERADIAFVHIRSAANGCFQCRAARA
jgi:hypothetical protein